MNSAPYSDEQLNAFVDAELTPNDRMEILKAATESETLRAKIVELQYLKASTQAAFPLPIKATPGAVSATANLTRYLTAAAMGGLSLFAVLATTGQLQLTRELPQTALNTVQTSPALQTRVVFHISSENNQDAELLLNQVELVLREHQNSRRPIRLEVVANNAGLRMLQAGRSQVAERIRQLHTTYPHLVFAACGNTLERMTKETGEQIEILPEAVIIRSGVSYITRRQQIGWSYIKV